MMLASLQELQLALTSATLTADAQVTGLTTDSRNIGQGNLFLALVGERFDAHDFLSNVADAGAAAVVVQRVPEGFTLPALVVPDTKQALGEIARYWRSQFSCPIIGVTGSNGKTTVKEMIASILSTHVGAEHYLSTAGNLNNDIGVPLTLLRLQKHHRCAVIELGMNHPGEIAYLASVSAPTVALVNNAQREHQEFMQSVAAVAQENGSVFLSLPVDGTAVFPADDTYSDMWRAMAMALGQRKIVTFGTSENADVIGRYQANTFGSDLQIRIAGQSFALRLAAAGIHNVMNALAAAACCHSIGVSGEDIAMGLQAFQPVNGRLQLKHAENGAAIIDDTYNANPDSVIAAIDVLATSGVNSILVLGDMGEVGTEGVGFHREIGAYAHKCGINKILTLGTLARHTSQFFGAGAEHFENYEALLTALDTTVLPTSTVLIKGSRFMKMERVVAHLTKQKQTIGNH
jgi:UDP-N-acetylmuramoyl-tripeptide--D-alanyl-D-alanine ligase